MLSSIPPNTVFKRTKPTKKLRDCQFYNISKKVPVIQPKETFSVEEVKLDLFEEDGSLKVVIGDFHGVNKDDLFTTISDGYLSINSKHSLNKRYYATIKLPESFETTVKTIEMRNGIMTVVLQQVKFEEVPAELQNLFDSCLKKFPELQDIELKLVKNRREYDTIEGAKGKVNGKDVVTLFVPDVLWGKWSAFKPIIFHELSHFINLENPDRIFYERADKKSIQLWNMLKSNNMLKCKVGE